MDLFGRKSRAELSVVKAMFVEQGQYLNGAVALLTERDNQIEDHLRTIQYHVLNDTQLRTTVTRLQQEIHALSVKPTISSQPLYMNDNEEDLKWQLDNNMIDTVTYQQMLQELAFENSEISLAVEDLPESFHY